MIEARQSISERDRSFDHGLFVRHCSMISPVLCVEEEGVGCALDGEIVI